MHPAAAFRWDDADAVRDFVRDVSFASIFAATPDGPRVAQTPLVWTGDNTLRFHLSRGNALTRHLDGMTVLAVVSGPDAYISPDWYGAKDQVPTWNYLSVEIEGLCHQLDDEALIDVLDRLSAEHEARLAPKAPWTCSKMSVGRFDAMLRGIAGFELRVEAVRTTLKLGQNKPVAQREAAADALEATGHKAMAMLMRSWQ
jgi:transcriptional regulator